MNNDMLMVLPLWYFCQGNNKLPLVETKCCDTLSFCVAYGHSLLTSDDDDTPGKVYNIKTETLTSGRPSSNPSSAIF